MSLLNGQQLLNTIGDNKVSFSAVPVVFPAAAEGHFLIVTDDGTSLGEVLETYIYDGNNNVWVNIIPNNNRVLYTVNNIIPTLAPASGVDTVVLLNGSRYEWNGTAWVAASVIFDATVDFSTLTPTTAGVVFTPNTPASTTVLYVSSVDGSQWAYNGTTYVPAPASNDWKITGNVGTVQATNFVGTTDNVGLSLRTNNVIRQTISNTGNVGFGTVNPLEKVDVFGNIRLASGTPTNAIYSENTNGLVLETRGNLFGRSRMTLQNINGSNGALFEVPDATSPQLVDFGFKTLAGQRNIRYETRILSTYTGTPEFQFGIAGDPQFVSGDNVNFFRKGNVGINVNPPQNRLHIGVGGVANTGGIRLPITSTSAAQTGQPIGVNANGDIVRLAATNFDATVSFSTATPTTGGVVFTPNTQANTTVLYVSAADGSQWTYNGTNYVTQPASADWKTAGNAGTVQATNFLGTTDNIGLSFRTNNVIRQTITNAGNVGVGTTAPTEKLHIDGVGNQNILLQSPTGGATTNLLKVRTWNGMAANTFAGFGGTDDGATSVRASIYVPNAANTGVFEAVSVLKATGNVGIGTTAPAYTLDVNGTARIVNTPSITTATKVLVKNPATGQISEQEGVGKVFYNGANITNATTTMQAIPALSFNAVVGWYVVKFYPLYNAATTATGAGFNLGAGTAVRTNQTMKAEIHNTDTASQEFHFNNLAQNYTNVASPRLTDNRAYIEAHFQVTTAGTIIPMFRSENTGLVTLRAGSYLTYEKIN